MINQVATILPCLTLCAATALAASDPLTADELSLHQRLLVLDTHLDTPVHFGRPGWDFAERHGYRSDLTQVDLPRMAEGGLDGGFFVIYTSQGALNPAAYAAARDAALMRAMNIRQTVARHPGQLELAFTAADAARIAAVGKRAVYQSLENSYPVGEDLTLLETFYRLGVRMAGPVHGRNNQFADSSSEIPRWQGLSPLGRRWVEEMNRLGMVIDASHASDTAFDELLELSRSPVILSHTGPKAIFDHPRNLDDERIRRLAAQGGVIQVNSLFLVPRTEDPALLALLAKREQLESMSPEQQAAMMAEAGRIPSLEVSPGADFELFMKSLLHVIAVAGIDHVGIGADWDGGGGVAGLEDVAALPKVTAALLRAGYSEQDVGKIWSGNLLRVLGEAEAIRHQVSQAGANVIAVVAESPEARLAAAGHVLPVPPSPVATYVTSVQAGNLLFLSGHGECGKDYRTGRVGSDLTLEEGVRTAERVGLCMLATIKAALGDLSRVRRFVRILGMVNATEDFTAHPEVMNGFSDLMVVAFGDMGRAARAATGMQSLPRGIPVEVEAIVEVVPDR